MGEEYPEVPEAAIPEGWERRGRSEDALFDAGAASVIGRTVLYVDAAIEAALEAAGAGDLLSPPDGDGAGESGGRLVGIDTVAPFGFATALSFRPPLAPGVGPAALFPIVLSEARRAFGADLRNRGFASVERESHGRIRTETGDRARLTRYDATYPLGRDAPADALQVEGWLAVWTTENAFRVAGGAYPTAGIDGFLADREDAPAIDPAGFREDLIGLIRSVK